MHRAAQRNRHWWLLLTQRGQIARDGARALGEDAIGQIFTRQQHALAQRLLTEIRKARLTKRGRSMLLQDAIVSGAAMQRQPDHPLLTFAERLAGWLVGANTDDRDFARHRRRTFNLIEKRKINLLDDFQNSFGLERRTVQPLLDLGQKPRVESLGLKPAQLLATYVVHTHKHTSFPPSGGYHDRCAICQDDRSEMFIATSARPKISLR